MATRQTPFTQVFYENNPRGSVADTEGKEKMCGILILE